MLKRKITGKEYSKQNNISLGFLEMEDVTKMKTSHLVFLIHGNGFLHICGRFEHSIYPK
jgi:hypothetical protein